MCVCVCCCPRSFCTLIKHIYVHKNETEYNRYTENKPNQLQQEPNRKNRWKSRKQECIWEKFFFSSYYLIFVRQNIKKVFRSSVLYMCASVFVYLFCALHSLKPIEDWIFLVLSAYLHFTCFVISFIFIFAWIYHENIAFRQFNA